MKPSPVPQSVLIVCTQRIGDVLLSTPLARSIKRSWPDTAIDYLVLPGTQGVLEGNPDVRRVLAFSQRADWRQKLNQLRHVWRRYDLSLATVASDRARLFAWAAAPKCMGFVARESGQTFKKRWLDTVVPFDDLHTHTVQMNLQMAKVLGLPPLAQVVNPATATWPEVLTQAKLRPQSYAVLHPSPKFRYKMWRDTAWVELGRWLQQQGLRVVLTASPDAEERRFVEDISSGIGTDVLCLAGQLKLSEIAELLNLARLYVGPDTAVTHMAAAAGIPTIALFGPSNPVKWAPWPHGWSRPDSPWHMQGLQQRGNVWLLQGNDPRGCVPCRLEGCERHLNSESRCLQTLTLETVQRAAMQCLR